MNKARWFVPLACAPAFAQAPPTSSTAGPAASGAAAAAAAQPPEEGPLSTATFTELKLRSIGPALISGRITSLAVDPANRAHYFIGVASGGVWRTRNAGVTYTPVFDDQGSYSIGTVALDPNNSPTVW